MRMSAFFLGLSAVILLSGCVESPPDGRSPDLTFANMKALELNVSKIEVQNNYKPPMQNPNVEHTFRTPPYVAAENLVKKQLVAAGHINVLRVNIDDASVIREELPVTYGFMGKFTNEPAEKLRARILLRFELFDTMAPGIVIGHAEVVAKREKTLMEGTSLAERDRAYFSLTEDMMNDLNEGLRRVVKSTFGMN